MEPTPQDLQRLENENRRLREAVEELSALNEVSVTISGSFSVQDINERIIARVVKHTQASQGAIFLLAEQSSAPMETVVRAKDSHVQESAVHMNLALTGWMIKNQRPLNASRVNDPEKIMTHMNETVRSTLSVPLRAQGRFIGALTVYNKQNADGFLPADTRFLSIVAGQSAQVIETARLMEEEKRLQKLQAESQKERDAAGVVQQTMLPSHLPSVRGYDIEAAYRPAGEVGGDGYDIVPLDKDRVFMILWDVSGKGIAAALVMAQTRALVRAHLGPWSDLDAGLREMARDVSEYVSIWSEPERYLTAFLATLDTRTHRMSYICAGHNPPMMTTSDGVASTLDAGGIPLGLMRGAEFVTATIEFAPGSRIVVFSDGVTELFDEQGVDYGEERLQNFLSQQAASSSAETVQRLMTHLDEFRGKALPSDDITLVVIRRTPLPSP